MKEDLSKLAAKVCWKGIPKRSATWWNIVAVIHHIGNIVDGTRDNSENDETKNWHKLEEVLKLAPNHILQSESDAIWK